MTSENNSLNQLIAFKQRDKFSDEAWDNRGLMPSASEISSKLSMLFNHSADRLIEAASNNANIKQLKTILKSCLSDFNKREYDTEEKEFICDLFNELSQIVNIDFANDLNRWLYGSVVNNLLKIQAALNPRKVLNTIHNTCPSCRAAIDTFIMRKEEGIPDFSWIIVKCKNCNNYSLISHGPNVKEVKFGNYEMIESLPKERFTKEQAEIRLEQLQRFK